MIRSPIQWLILCFFLLFVAPLLRCNPVHEVQPSGVFENWETLDDTDRTNLIRKNRPDGFITKDGFIRPEIGFPLSSTALSIFAKYFNELLREEENARRKNAAPGATHLLDGNAASDISVTFEVFQQNEQAKEVDIMIGASVNIPMNAKSGEHFDPTAVWGDKATKLFDAIRKTVNEKYYIKDDLKFGNAYYANANVVTKQNWNTEKKEKKSRVHGETAVAEVLLNIKALRVLLLAVTAKNKPGNIHNGENAVTVHVGGSPDRPPCFACNVMQHYSETESFFIPRTRQEYFDTLQRNFAEVAKYKRNPSDSAVTEEDNKIGTEYAKKVLKEAYGESTDGEPETEQALSLAGRLYLLTMDDIKFKTRPTNTKIVSQITYDAKPFGKNNPKPVPSVSFTRSTENAKARREDAKNFQESSKLLVRYIRAMHKNIQSMQRTSGTSGDIPSHMDPSNPLYELYAKFGALLKVKPVPDPLRLFLYAVTHYDVTKQRNPPAFLELEGFTEGERKRIFNAAFDFYNDAFTTAKEQPEEQPKEKKDKQKAQGEFIEKQSARKPSNKLKQELQKHENPTWFQTNGETFEGYLEQLETPVRPRTFSGPVGPAAVNKFSAPTYRKRMDFQYFMRQLMPDKSPELTKHDAARLNGMRKNGGISSFSWYDAYEAKQKKSEKTSSTSSTITKTKTANNAESSNQQNQNRFSSLTVETEKPQRQQRQRKPQNVVSVDQETGKGDTVEQNSSGSDMSVGKSDTGKENSQQQEMEEQKPSTAVKERDGRTRLKRMFIQNMLNGFREFCRFCRRILRRRGESGSRDD